jgi:hypothetical protein
MQFSLIFGILLLVSSVYSNGIVGGVDYSSFTIGTCFRQATTVTTLQQTLSDWNTLHSGNSANCWFCPYGIDCTAIISGCQGRRCSDSELVVSSSNQISCSSVSVRSTDAFVNAPNIGVARNDFTQFDASVMNSDFARYNTRVAPGYGYGAPVVRAPLYNAPYYGAAWNNNLLVNDYARYNALVAPVPAYGYAAPVIRAPLYNAPYYGSAWNNNMLVNDYTRYDSSVMNTDFTRYDSRYNGLAAPVLPVAPVVAPGYGYGAPVVRAPLYNGLAAPVLPSVGYGAAAPIIRSSAPIIRSGPAFVDNSYGNSYGGPTSDY